MIEINVHDDNFLVAYDEEGNVMELNGDVMDFTIKEIIQFLEDDD